MSEFKNELPKIMNYELRRELDSLSFQFVVDFGKNLMPFLKRISLCDDIHMRKYIHATTTEPIYQDAIKEQWERVCLLEEVFGGKNEDFWKPIRDKGCTARKPTDEGFVFASMLFSEASPYMREKFLKAIVVENGKLSISEKILDEQSIVEPTYRQRECYDLLADFCARLKEKNYKRKNMHSLFIYDKDGDLKPNIKGILF